MSPKDKREEELEAAGDRETFNHCNGGSCGGDKICACDCYICCP